MKRLLPVLALLTLIPMAPAQVSIGVGSSLDKTGGVDTLFGRTRLYVAVSGKAVVFEADPKDVTELPTGWKVDGELGLRTASGVVKMARAEALFERSASGGIERMRGLAFLPPPYVSNRIEIASPAMAEMGVDLGENLDLGVPLNPKTPYVFFRFEAGLSMSIGIKDDPNATKPFTLTVPGGVDGMYILDPSDPFYYVSGAFLEGEKDGEESGDQEESKGSEGKDQGGDDEKKASSDEANDESGDEDAEEEGPDATTGMGRSENGRIPFIPRDVRGLEAFVKPFHGSRLKKGVYPVAGLPLEVRGTMVTGFAATSKDGFDPMGIGLGPKYHAGANGDLAVTFPLAKVAGSSILDFGFDLGTATMGLDVDGDVQRAWFRGVIDPDLSWIPAGVPVRQDGRVDLVGHLSTDWASSFFQADGVYGLTLADFGGWQAGKLGGEQKVTGHLRADRHGLVLRGSANPQFDWLRAELATEVEARLASGDDSLRFGGTFLVAGNRIRGDLTIAQAMELRGELETRGLSLDLQGQLEFGSGMRLKGELGVHPRFQQELHGAIAAEAAAVQAEIDAELAKVEAATREYEFELSLRGIRPAIPKLCKEAIQRIRTEVPKRINSRWPKRGPVEVPGRKAALKSAKKSYAPHVKRLERLAAAARQGSDAVLRGEIEAAIRELLAHDTLKIKVKVLGTVYEEKVLSKSDKQRLQEALAAIRALPAKSDRKVSAQRAFAELRKSDVLRDVGERIRSGATANLPTIERITFDMPAGLSGPGGLSIGLTVRTGDDVRESRFWLNPDNPLGPVHELAKAWRYR